MSQSNRKLYAPLFLIFIVFNTLFITGRTMFENRGFNREVLIVGNLILFLVTFASLFVHIRGFLHKNVNAFLRSVYTSLLIKMFACVAAVIIYAVLAKDNLNKPALFVCMGLYFVYTFVEIRIIFRLLKQSKNNE